MKIEDNSKANNADNKQDVSTQENKGDWNIYTEFCEWHWNRINLTTQSSNDFFAFPIQWDRSIPLVDFMYGVYDKYINELKEFKKKKKQSVDIDEVTNVCSKILYYLNKSINGDLFNPDELDWLNEYLKKAMATIISQQDTEQSGPTEPRTFYRMRGGESCLNLFQRYDFYHIPYNLIYLSKSERYSAAGYPCFYLGYSKECCLKEIDTVGSMIELELKKDKSFTIIDTTLFSECHRQIRKIKMFEWWPILAACNVTSDKDANFKEEYVFPQLLTKYVLYLKKRYRDLSQKNEKSEDEDKEYKKYKDFEDIEGIRYYSCKEPRLDIEQTTYSNLVLFPETRMNEKVSQKSLYLPHNEKHDIYDRDLMNRFEFKNAQNINLKSPSITKDDNKKTK